MASGELKNRVRFSTTLSKRASEGLKQLSEKTMIPISKLMDIAVERLLIEGVSKD